ncbi:hypothetical protein [Ilumatobacter sp.]|uniref:hypothetical protein n=1 Tax=Ilumatobacter sp. TaxID=1967498 RepID=UPI003B52A6F3
MEPESSTTGSAVASTTEPSDPSTSVPPTTEGEPERLLPDDLGPMTESIPFDDAPGVDTPGQFYEIYEMGYLYLPDTTDPDDRDVRPPTEDELPIIAAYGRALKALFNQLTVFPVEREPSPAMKEAFVDGGVAYSENAFKRFREDEVFIGFPLGRPDIHRPYVLTEPRSELEAVIWNCKYDASIPIRADGSIAIDEVSEIYERAGNEVAVRLIDGQWKVSSIITKEAACGDL